MNSIYKVLEKRIVFWSAIASIISLIFFFIYNLWAVIISLSLFCLILLLLTYKLISSINKLLIFKHPTGFLRNSNIVRYSTIDGSKIEFEVYRHIQCKRVVMHEFNYPFKWSGSHSPLITSKLQDVLSVTGTRPEQWDEAILRFRKPLFYNENAIIHFFATLDDTDHKSGTHVESKVDSPVDIIITRIELKYKKASFDKPATLKRRKITAATNVNYEELQSIPFDKVSKSYEHAMINPETDYYYRIEWER